MPDSADDRAQYVGELGADQPQLLGVRLGRNDLQKGDEFTGGGQPVLDQAVADGPSKVAQGAAVRAVAAERRERDLADGTLIAAVCPGMVDTATSRPWFSDFSQAQSSAKAAPLDLVFADGVDPSLYGELVRFGKALSRYDGTPPVEQDRMLTP